MPTITHENIAGTMILNGFFLESKEHREVDRFMIYLITNEMLSVKILGEMRDKIGIDWKYLYLMEAYRLENNKEMSTQAVLILSNLLDYIETLINSKGLALSPQSVFKAIEYLLGGTEKPQKRGHWVPVA